MPPFFSWTECSLMPSMTSTIVLRHAMLEVERVGAAMDDSYHVGMDLLKTASRRIKEDTKSWEYRMVQVSAEHPALTDTLPTTYRLWL